MATDTPPTDALAPRDRWQLFEALAGERVRASDAAWALALSPAQRLAVADDLFVTVRDVRRAAGQAYAAEFIEALGRRRSRPASSSLRPFDVSTR